MSLFDFSLKLRRDILDLAHNSIKQVVGSSVVERIVSVSS